MVLRDGESTFSSERYKCFSEDVNGGNRSTGKVVPIPLIVQVSKRGMGVVNEGNAVGERSVMLTKFGAVIAKVTKSPDMVISSKLEEFKEAEMRRLLTRSIFSVFRLFEPLRSIVLLPE